MAHRIVKTVLNNGTKSLILHTYFESDGVEGELSNYVLVDPQTMYTEFDLPKDQNAVRPVIAQVWYSFAWFDGLLAFDDLVPGPTWALPRDVSNYFDFRYFGGITYPFVPPQDRNTNDRSGKIVFSTAGFTEAGAVGTMIIELRKNTG